MGHRHLVLVFSKSKWVIAQYGSHGCHPASEGVNLLKFLRKPYNVEELILALDDGMALITNEDDLLRLQKTDRTAPSYIWEGNGSGVLDALTRAERPIAISHSIDFLQDTLYCEWTYMVDMDARRFEAYAPSSNAAAEIEYADLTQVRKMAEDSGETAPPMAACYSFDELPEERDYLANIKTVRLEER